MAGGRVGIFLLAVASLAAANSCTQTITWSCSSPPHLTLQFSEATVINCGETYSKELFTSPKSLKYSGNINQNKTYTAVMVDPDAPGHVDGQAWLHWIRAGVTGADLTAGTMHTGHDIISYRPPTPPKGTGTHRYFVFLFEETKAVKPEQISRRSKFDLTEYATRQQLCGPLASNMFQTQY